MPDITNTLLIAFHDGLGEDVVPTANFTPPTSYPLANISNSRLFSRTRTPDLTADMQLTWDFGSEVEANVFALMGTNASLSTLRRFRAADNAAITTNVVQSGASLSAAFDTSMGGGYIANHVQPWGRTLIYVHSTSFTKRYIRWHQSDTTNVDGYQEWGIARLGTAFQVSGGFETWRTVPKLTGPVGGHKSLRGHELTLHNLTESEAYDLQNMCLALMESERRVLVIPVPLAPHTWLADAIWSKLESVYMREPVAQTPYSDKRFRVVVTFREVDR